MTGPKKAFLMMSALPTPLANHQNLAGLHDGFDAHGVGFFRDQIFVVVKEALVGLNGLFGQVDTVGAKLKSGTRLVKANVAIVANAQQLQTTPPRCWMISS